MSVSGSKRSALVVGAGVVGLSIADRLLSRDDVGSVTVAANAFANETTSKSGGLVLPFLTSDTRTPNWSSRSADIYRYDIARRHPSLARLLTQTPTILLSQGASAPHVEGHLGKAHDFQPDEHGFSHYRSGVRLDDGLVISTCQMLPNWTRLLERDPRCRFMAVSRLTMSDVSELARAVGADTVYLAVGSGAWSLLGDRLVEGVEGVLLLGNAPSGTSYHRDHAVMDEDDPKTFTYSIPHVACGPQHTLMVGGSGHYRDLPEDFATGRAHGRLDAAQQREAHRILARARDQFPDLRDWKPVASWVGYRSSRPTMCVEVIDDSDGVRYIGAYGAGGSGWTVAPAAAEVALFLAGYGSLPNEQFDVGEPIEP